MASSKTSFEVSSKVQATEVQFDCPPRNSKSAHIASELRAFKSHECTEILNGTQFPGKNIDASENGFVYAALEAYNQHHYLVLRPEDIWQAIMTQFSFYINANAEKFRSKFVNFKGKKELTVSANSSGPDFRSLPFDKMVEMMENLIHENLVDDQVRDWIMPNFSTTTGNDRVTAGAVFMATLQKYFAYRFGRMCGIPGVTLDGTVEDWQNIRKRLDKLDEYDLKEWKDILAPILDEFVLAKQGNPKVNFWKRIVSYSGKASGNHRLTGWITAFCYFNKEGKKQEERAPGRKWPSISTRDVPPGVVAVDVIIEDRGKEYKAVMIAGSMGREIGADKISIQPKSGWVIALTKNKPKNAKGVTGSKKRKSEDDHDHGSGDHSGNNDGDPDEEDDSDDEEDSDEDYDSDDDDDLDF